MTLGRFVYLGYHRPVGCVKRSIREGGPIEQWRTEKGRREMEAAAWQLTSISSRDKETKRLEREAPSTALVASSGLRVKGSENSPLVTRLPKGHLAEPRFPSHEIGGKPIEVHVLTGQKFWYQTAFCLYSFAWASGREVRAVIHDDGSLDQRHADVLLRLFPGSRVETCDMTMARLDELLPTSKFPTLRARRLELPLIKKITDIHLGGTGWRLFFDADLLFFRRPELLLEWWDDPRVPLTSVDAAYAYGYSMDLLNEIAGKPVYDFINTGLLGLKSDAIDWEKMEYWCRTLIERAGTDYYQEQALVALQVAGSDRVVLPQQDYLVYPRGEEAARCSAVMHHYVDLSKKSYFRDNWRRFARSL